MMDVTFAQESQDAIGYIISVVVPLVAGIVAVAVTALAGAGAWASVQRVARQVRGYVDEADDFVIVTLDGIGEFLLHRELDAAQISQLLTAVTDALAAPPREVNIGDAAK